MVPKPLLPLLAAFAGLLAILSLAAPSPVGQRVLVDSLAPIGGPARCNFSEWSRTTKEDFLQDLFLERAFAWTIVLGNEGGDTDSMAVALAWAYQLTHFDPPQVRRVAVLYRGLEANPHT